jgi:hypothetical protein
MIRLPFLGFLICLTCAIFSLALTARLLAEIWPAR